MRAFVALNLDVAATRALAAHATRLRASPDAPKKATWVAPTNLHVTLKFLGEIDRALVPALSDALATIARATPAIPVEGFELTGYPKPVRARVLACDLRSPEAERPRVAALHAAVEDAFAELGLEREERAFRPHVTFARARPFADVRRLVEGGPSPSPSPPPPGTRLVEIVLYESALRPSGAEYTALFRAPLGE